MDRPKNLFPETPDQFQNIDIIYNIIEVPDPKKNLNYDRMVIVCSDWHFHE